MPPPPNSRMQHPERQSFLCSFHSWYACTVAWNPGCTGTLIVLQYKAYCINLVYLKVCFLPLHIHTCHSHATHSWSDWHRMSRHQSPLCPIKSLSQTECKKASDCTHGCGYHNNRRSHGHNDQTKPPPQASPLHNFTVLSKPSASSGAAGQSANGPPPPRGQCPGAQEPRWQRLRVHWL